MLTFRYLLFAHEMLKKMTSFDDEESESLESKENECNILCKDLRGFERKKRLKQHNPCLTFNLISDPHDDYKANIVLR